jgi:hypothetical protein
VTPKQSKAILTFPKEKTEAGGDTGETDDADDAAGEDGEADDAADKNKTDAQYYCADAVTSRSLSLHCRDMRIASPPEEKVLQPFRSAAMVIETIPTFCSGFAFRPTFVTTLAKHVKQFVLRVPEFNAPSFRRLWYDRQTKSPPNRGAWIARLNADLRFLYRLRRALRNIDAAYALVAVDSPYTSDIPQTRPPMQIETTEPSVYHLDYLSPLKEGGQQSLKALHAVKTLVLTFRRRERGMYVRAPNRLVSNHTNRTLQMCSPVTDGDAQARAALLAHFVN